MTLPPSLYDGTLPEKIGLFGLGHLHALIQSSFEKLPYVCESYSELKSFAEWVHADSPRLILLDGHLLQEMQAEPECAALTAALKKLNIPSIVFAHSREEIKRWSFAWPLAHFMLGPVTAATIQKKIFGVMADGLFPQMPLAAIMSDKPYVKSHLEMIFKNVGMRVMALSHLDKNHERFSGLLAALPDFYIRDVTSKSWGEEEVKKLLGLVSPGRTIPGFLVTESGHSEKKFGSREIYRLDDSSKLVEAIGMELNKEKNIQLKTCRDRQTGLYLPEIFMELAEREISLASRTGDKFSVLRVCLGNLDEIEQHYGPIFVKELAIHLGLFIQNRVRSTDLVARAPDGEIFLLLTRVSRDLASLIGERLRHSFKKEASFPEGEDTFTPHFNFEILTFPDDMATLDEMKTALSAPKTAMAAKLQSDG